MSAAGKRPTSGAALARGRAALSGAGIDTASLDARLLLAAAMAVPVSRLVGFPEDPVPPEAEQRYDALLRRRLAREPMSHILGRREFWSLDFAVTADTLTPRPDSETLVAAALEALPDRDAPARVLDLGTGTGCLLLAILHERPHATGVGVDRSAAALDVAQHNAAALGLGGRATFHVGDWGRALTGPFDLVISNPPYIATGELPGLPPEVRHEPALALDGGADGLDAYRALAPDVARLLRPGGAVVLEIGQGQAAAVEEILTRAGLLPVGRRADLAGIDRCIVANSSPHQR